MSPKWFFYEPGAPSVIQPQVQFDGTLVATTNANRFDITGYSITGTDAAYFQQYAAATPLRRNSFGNQMQFLFALSSSSPWVNAADFLANVTVQNLVLEIGGNLLAPTSFDVVASGTTSTMRARFFGSQTYITNYWSNLSAGDAFQFKMFYV